jgi:hypothetical protein
MEERTMKKFKRPYLIVEKIFERVALACGKCPGSSSTPNKCNPSGTPSDAKHS